MKSFTLFLLLAILSGLFILSNNNEKIAENFSTDNFEIGQLEYDLFSPIEADPMLNDVVKNAAFFKLDKAELESLFQDQPLQFTLKLPEIPGLPAKIVFDKKQVITSDLMVKNNDGQPEEVHTGLHYRKVDKGIAMAAISIFENHIAAIIATENGNFNISELVESKGEYILFNETNLVDQPEPFTCTPLYPSGYKMPSYSDYSQFNLDNAIIKADPTDPVVRVYVECDTDMVTMNGGTVQGVYDYVTTLFNFCGLVFEGEDIILQLSEMLVWTELDPYNISYPLGGFASRWQEAEQNFNGDLAHLLRGFSSGGLAWVDVLCNPDRPLGLSGVGTSNWNVFPNFIYSVYVVSHELGHNLGSPHTHNCSWGPTNDQAIDNCATPEGSCTFGPPPVNGGTIMSYCSGFNLLNGFGPEPGDLIRMKVANASCLQNLRYYTNCQLDSIIVISECMSDPTPSDPTDNQYTIQFNVKGTGTPMTLRATDLESGQSWDFSHETDVVTAPFNAFEGPRNIRIEDLSNSACVTERTVFPSVGCYRPDQCAPYVWDNTNAGSLFETIEAVAALTGGGYIGAGRTESDDGDFQTSSGSDIFVVKVDENGNQVWLKQFGGENSDEAYDVIAMGDGGAVIVGLTNSQTGFGTSNHGDTDGYALRLDANGNEIWKRLYGGTYYDAFFSAIQLPGGDFVFGGSSASNNGDVPNNFGNQDGWLLRADMNGNIVWSQVYGDNLFNKFEDINPGHGNSIAASGTEYNSSASQPFQVWAAEVADNGNLNWQTVLSTPEWDFARGLFPNDNGGYLLLYQSHRPYAARLDPSGIILESWAITTAGGKYFENGVKLSGNRIAVGGRRSGITSVSGGDPNTSDFWLYLMDGDGNRLYEKTYGAHRNESGYAINGTNDGGYIMGGNRAAFFESDNFEAWMVKFGADFCSQPGLCFVSAVASNVQCSDNGTVSDPSDDTFMFDVMVSGAGSCGTGWTDGGTSGNYGESVTFGPFLISGGDQTLVFTDNADPSFTGSVSVSAPAPCSFGPSFCENNQLQNPGFEANLNYWQREGNVTISDNPHNGENAAQICDGTGSITQLIDAVPGQEYTASAWVRKTSASAGYSTFELRFLTSSWMPLLSAPQVFNNTTYEQIVQTKTAPAEAAYVQVLMYKEAGGCVETDDWELCESEVVPLCQLFIQVQNYVCNDNGTPNDSDDDIFTFDILVTGNNTGNLGWSASFGGNVVNGNYGIPETEGPLLIANGPLSLEVSDVENIDCVVFSTIFTPLPCSNQALPDFILHNFLTVQFNQSGSTVIDPGDEVLAGSTVNFPAHGATLIIPGPPPNYTLAINSYLSTDMMVDPNDELISTHNRMIGASQQFFGFTEGSLGSGVIPASTTPGNYFLIMKYDAEDLIDEVDENNNFVVLPINVITEGVGEIDLELSLTQSNPSPAIYSVYQVTATLTNTGTQQANGVTVSFQKPGGVVYTGGNEYTALQGTFNPNGDEKWTVGSIPAGGSATLTVNYFLLQEGAPNAYAQVASANEQDEDSTPGNGTCCTPIEDDEASTGDSDPPILNPDLVLNNININNSPIQPGQVLTYNFDISNIGNGPAEDDFNVKAWISTDANISSNDIQDGIVPTGNFPAGLTIEGVPGASTLPPDLEDGQYYLILKVDADESINESNEGNNLISSTFIVEGGTQPGECDDFIGAGSINCTSTNGIGQLEVLHRSNDDVFRATLDENGQLISGNFFAPALELNNYSVQGNELVKTTDGVEIYRVTIPDTLFNQYDLITSFTEFQGGYILFAFVDLSTPPSLLEVIYTDLSFNILQMTSLDFAPNSSFPILRDAQQISTSEFAFLYTTNAGNPGSAIMRLIVLNDNLEIQSSDIFAQNIFSIIGSIKKTSCETYTLSISQMLFFCHRGSCFSRDVIEGHFENGEFVIENSYQESEISSMGFGTRARVWKLFTSDGGLISANNIQQLSFPPAPVNNSIHIEKTIDGMIVWEKDVEVAAASQVRKLGMSVDELVFLSEKNNSVFVESLTCLEENTDPPGDGVDLDLTMNANNLFPDIYSAEPLNLTVTNSGTEPASGIIIEWKRPAGTVYTGGNEWSSNSGVFDPHGNEAWTISNLAAGESVTLIVNYFFLTSDELNPFAQVIASNEPDVDSSPGNGTCCVPNEDDEASITLNSATGNARGNRVERDLSHIRRLSILNIYPNPAKYWVTLELFALEDKDSQLDIYDNLGQPIYSENIFLKKGLNTFEINTRDWNSGHYSVICRSGTRKAAYGRFMKIWED